MILLIRIHGYSVVNDMLCAGSGMHIQADAITQNAKHIWKPCPNFPFNLPQTVDTFHIAGQAVLYREMDTNLIHLQANSTNWKSMAVINYAI
jgi:hypothetical protein